MNIKIRRLTAEMMNKHIADEVILLIEELSGKPKFFNVKKLREILRQKNFYAFAALDGDKMAGLGSIYFQKDFCHHYGFINDMVVSDSCRGFGIGKKILHKLIDLARRKNVDSVNLTSNPKRITAIAMYEKYGFEKYDTNYYRFKNNKNVK